MIPVQHQRIAFKYAVAYLTDEISSIEEYLKDAHMICDMELALNKRLNELKNDLKSIIQYNLHD